MIPITKPYLGTEETNAARMAIESGWVSQGPQVEEFERQMASFCGTADAVAVSSCTSALHLALLVLGVGPGDEVICPSMSFIATANAIRYCGATPVFVDVDPLTYNLCPEAANAAVTSRTKCVLVVHQVGLPADLDRFLEVGARHGVKILEDAACAIGSRYKGRPIGGHSEMACFSFHPRKVITTGEGGMITTNNPKYGRHLRLLRQHGMSVPDTVRHKSQQTIQEEYLCLGFNYRMTDIQAAIGIEQLKKLEWIIERRCRIAAMYDHGLRELPWLNAPHVPAYATPNFQSYAVSLSTEAPRDRDELMQLLLDNGVATRRGIMLSHLEPAYEDLPVRGDLLESSRASERSLLLPMYPQMTDEEVELVIQTLRTAAEHALKS